VLSNKASPNGNSKRTYLRLKQREGPIFPWKKIGYGRLALCLIALIAEEKVKPGDTYDRSFRDCGLTDEWLLSELLRFMPWLAQMYERKRGTALTAHVVYDRWHKGCVYQTKPGAGNSRTVGCSTEHPRNHPSLQPLLQAADTLFKRNRPITQADAARACYACGMKFGET
jgi:hypothetical protein